MPIADDPLRALQVRRDRAAGGAGRLGRASQVKAAALNHHDVWSLRGVGLPADRLPMILGCDAAGSAPDGREVIVYAVVNDPDFAGLDATYDPRRSLLSERYPGTFAGTVRVPAANLIDKPAELSFAEAACLPTAWLTAYRMLFTASGARPGDTVLVQGAGGGVATALVVLGAHAGLRIWVTSRDEAARRAGRRARCRPGLRLGCAAARAGRCGDGHRRRGDLVALDQRPAARRHPGDQRHHLGRRAGEGGADQDLLQAAAGDRLHHGHPRRAELARPDAGRDRRPAGDRPDAAARRAPGTASPP